MKNNYFHLRNGLAYRKEKKFYVKPDSNEMLKICFVPTECLCLKRDALQWTLFTGNFSSLKINGKKEVLREREREREREE